jgi:hypothetical protein
LSKRLQSKNRQKWPEVGGGITPTAYARNLALIKKQEVQSQQLMRDALRGGIVLRMGAIFGLVMTAGVLALSGALTDGTMALLSGIAGYVLGSVRNQNSHPRAATAKSTQPAPPHAVSVVSPATTTRQPPIDA